MKIRRIKKDDLYVGQILFSEDNLVGIIIKYTENDAAPFKIKWRRGYIANHSRDYLLYHYFPQLYTFCAEGGRNKDK